MLKGGLAAGRLFRVWVLACGLLVTLAGCSHQSILDSGTAPPAAILAAQEREIRESLADDPENPRLNNEMARLLLYQNQADEAEKYGLKASELAPFEAVYLETLGDIYLKQNKRFRALMAYNQAVQMDPRMLSSQVKLAITHERVGETEKGIQVLKGTVAREPGYFEARYHLARMLFTTKKTTPAMKETETALAIRPNDPQARLLQIRIAKATGNYSQALLLISNALRSAPNDPSLVREKLDVHYQRQEWEKALEVLKSLESNVELETEDLLIRVEILKSQGQYRAAGKILQQLLEKQPDHPLVLLAVSRGLIQEGDFAGALQYLNRSLVQEPDNLKAMYWKAVILYRLNEVVQGNLALDSAEKINPDYPKIRLLRIQRLLAERKVAEASQKINEFLAANPTDYHGLLIKGDVLSMQGNLAEAGMVLYALPQNESAIRFARARLAYLKGDFSKTLEEISPLMDEPNPPWEAAYLYGSALGLTGKASKAINRLTPFVNRQGVGALHRLLGNLYLLDGKPKSAERVFTKGLALYPRDLGLIDAASRLALATGNWVQARDWLEAGIEKESYLVPVFLDRLSQVYNKLNNPQKAAYYLRRYLGASDPVLREAKDPIDDGVLFRQAIPVIDSPGPTLPVSSEPPPAP